MTVKKYSYSVASRLVARPLDRPRIGCVRNQPSDTSARTSSDRLNAALQARGLEGHTAPAQVWAECEIGFAARWQFFEKGSMSIGFC
ncbi:hypothetical protein, partial [Mycobacterium sp. 1165178.9]|uniref:hypothetical protein n=1 Tax=Mycobacterium sp. 1165178.9 TaxID=1834070 RepID=UPI001E535BBB